MKKLKKQNIIKIKPFFSNYINLNKKKNLYEQNILLNLDTFKILEFQDNNLYLPKTLINKYNIFSIQQEYNNSLLLTYNITYSILLSFHNIIIKEILQQNYKKIKNLFIIKQKKKIQNFNDFYKNKFKNIIYFQKNKYFFVIFGYIFSIKYNNKIYFKIKNKKFKLYNIIKKKKLTFFEKKIFNFYILQEEHLKHRYNNIKINKNKYILSRLQYLNIYLKKNK